LLPIRLYWGIHDAIPDLKPTSPTRLLYAVQP
jgi:hypothetical protein